MTTPANVVLLAGSPSSTSRSAQLLAALGQQLRAASLGVRQFSARDFDAQALLAGDTEATQVKQLRDAVKAAQGIVLATPVYKGTYTGALKLVVDVIEPDALVGKFALTIGTARQPGHL